MKKEYTKVTNTKSDNLVIELKKGDFIIVKALNNYNDSIIIKNVDEKLVIEKEKK